MIEGSSFHFLLSDINGVRKVNRVSESVISLLEQPTLDAIARTLEDGSLG